MRERKDVQDIGCGLSIIKRHRPIQYRFKEGNDRIDFGFTAQDIEALLGMVIAPMVKAMQEQQTLIEKQQGLIERQQTLIEALTSRFQAVEAKLADLP